MNVPDVEIQLVTETKSIPSNADIDRWSRYALKCVSATGGIVVRLVDRDESQTLNSHYRNKDNPTNVLSFPFDAPPGIAINHLGDLVICAPVVEQEAKEQGKSLSSHWAHMIVHGVLHLAGFDHIEEDQAKAMEELEIEILKELGFENPYD